MTDKVEKFTHEVFGEVEVVNYYGNTLGAKVFSDLNLSAISPKGCKFIYVVSYDDGLVKYGVTSNFRTRYQSLQEGRYADKVYLCLSGDALKVEKSIGEHFKASVVKGEYLSCKMEDVISVLEDKVLPLPEKADTPLVNPFADSIIDKVDISDPTFKKGYLDLIDCKLLILESEISEVIKLNGCSVTQRTY